MRRGKRVCLFIAILIGASTVVGYFLWRSRCREKDTVLARGDWGEVSNGLRCRLLLAKIRKTVALETRVHVEFQNVSSHNLTVKLGGNKHRPRFEFFAQGKDGNYLVHPGDFGIGCPEKWDDWLSLPAEHTARRTLTLIGPFKLVTKGIPIRLRLPYQDGFVTSGKLRLPREVDPPSRAEQEE